MKRIPTLAILLLPLGAAEGDVVINEIFYNEPGAAEAGEFIELHNTGVGAADISGWAMTEGIHFTLPSGTVLAPGGFLVIAADPDRLRASHAGITAVGPYGGVLSNSGETLTLSDAGGRVMDTVRFGDGEDWPQAADGDGASLELVKPSAPRDFPGNWAAGNPPTPGARNSSASDRLDPKAWDIEHAPERVNSAEEVVVSARVFSETPLSSVTLRVTLGPTTKDYALRDDGAAPDTAAEDGLHAARVEPLPSGTFAKYKVLLTDSEGEVREFPSGDDESDYRAWLVHDGDIGGPSPLVWIFLSQEKLNLLAAYAQVRSTSDPLYPEFDTAFDGFAVLDGVTHRKVAIRHRGGFASRHAGRLKYSWRLAFPDWDRYHGRRTLIVQGNMHWDDPYMRGDNGLQDKLCSMTFDRAGVPSPRTRFISLLVNGQLFGYHVELEDIDETFLERNGTSGLGDLYKHGRTASADLFPRAASQYPTAYEKQIGDLTDYSSLRGFVDGLASVGGSVPGTVSVTGRIWSRDSGTRPEQPTFTAAGLTGLITSRRAVGIFAYDCLAEFDNICFRGAGESPPACGLLQEDGESIADWQAVDGEWEGGGAIRLLSPKSAAHHRLGRANVFDVAQQPVTVTYDVRITSPKVGDCWAGVGVFLGNPGSYAAPGTVVTALRHAGASSEGLHLVQVGTAWLSQSGRFPWTVGQWYRVEARIEVSQPGDEHSAVAAYLGEHVDLGEFGRYSAGVILATHWDSTNQNYFFYQDELRGDRWVMFPWDFDITWGYSRRKPPPAQGHNLHPYDGTSWNPEPNEFGVNALRQAYLKVPQLREVLNARLAEALVTYFTESEIHPVIDRIVRSDGAESQADIDKWNALDTSWNWQSFQFHASFDKTYVSKRRKYLAEFLDMPPLLSQPSVAPAPAGPADELTFEVNALGSRYDGTHDTGRGNLQHVFLHRSIEGVENVAEMTRIDSGATDFYRVTVPATGKAVRVFYRFSATDDREREGRLPDPESAGGEWLAIDVGGAPPAEGDVVINEILYHPRYYDIEFVELKNNLWRAVDIGGWKLWAWQAGLEYTMPEGTVIPPAGYLVLSRDVRAVCEYYDIVNVAPSDLPFSLDNGGDRIRLLDPAGSVMDDVAWDDQEPWPAAADGEGPSLELVDSRLPNDAPGAWAASARQGTPGRPNSVSAPDVPPQPDDDERVTFHRGDVDSSGVLDLSDAVRVLGFLFLGGSAPICLEAADAGNDGKIDISDPVFILSYLFLGGPPPAAPGPPRSPCGLDPDPPGSAKDLGCVRYDGC